MRYGYGRVSSRGQRLYGCSLKEQKEQLLAQGISEENIYLDDYTGTKMSRPQFDELCSRLQPGDELVVSKLDRLARTSLEGPKQHPKHGCGRQYTDGQGSHHSHVCFR